MDRAAEAEIMDWADDVTYSVHDIEDFFRAGLIPLHLMKNRQGQSSTRERDRFFAYVMANEKKDKALQSLTSSEIQKIFDDLLIYTGVQLDQPYEGSREDHAALRMFTSRLINRFINAVTLEPDPTKNKAVRRQELAEREVGILKQLTWCYVIEAPSLAIQHEAQKKVIVRVTDAFLKEVRQTKPSGILPAYFRDMLRLSTLSDVEKQRAVIDLVSGMTERQAIDLYQRLEGISVASGFDKIVV